MQLTLLIQQEMLSPTYARGTYPLLLCHIAFSAPQSAAHLLSIYRINTNYIHDPDTLEQISCFLNNLEEFASVVRKSNTNMSQPTESNWHN